jgi:signal transduction histidine kinase
LAGENRRKIFIIHKLQVRIILRVTGIIVGVAVILLVAFIFILKNNISSLPISGELVNQALAKSIWPAIIIAIILFTVSAWLVILTTHKIYGPLYRLSRYIRKICNGEKTDDINFRRGDAIDGLTDIYNELRRTLEKTLHYDYKEMVRIFSGLEDVLDKLYNKKIRDRELYDELQRICNRIAKTLDITSDTIEKDKQI